MPAISKKPDRALTANDFDPVEGGVPYVAPEGRAYRAWCLKRYTNRYDLRDQGDEVVVTLRPNQAVVCIDAGADDNLAKLCADLSLDPATWSRAFDWSESNYYVTRRADVDALAAIAADRYPGISIKTEGATVTAAGSVGWHWDDCFPDLDDARDDDDDKPDPKNQLTVLSRGLKVNKQSVAADTFKNSVSAIINSGLVPAFNQMAQHVEFIGDVPWDVSKYGRVLDDAVLSAVRFHLIAEYQGNDFDPSGKNLNEALDGVAYGRRFNPVRDYLDRLRWDGALRLGKLFGHYFNCGVDPYTRGVSIAFMVGAVARIRRPGCKFDTMPVLKGPQGWNKSTALRVLFGDEHFSDTNLGPLTNKDASMKLRGKWCHEFSEIESLRKHEINTLKAFISSQVDRQRDPYARRAADVARCTVFAGTVNEGGYLADATGGRRFWPLDLQAPIDVAALEADRDQLWAEAAALEADGVSLVLPEKLWPVAAERQDAETIEDPWTDTLRDFLARRAAQVADDAFLEADADDEDAFDSEPPPPPDRVHTSELFDALGIPAKDQNRTMTNRLRSVMEARLGWRHVKSLRIGDAVRAGYDR